MIDSYTISNQGFLEKVKDKKNSTILGFDVGTKKIGIAIGHIAVPIAIPLCTYKVDNFYIKKIQNIILERDVVGFVIGLPLDLDGNRGLSFQMIEKFLKNIRKEIKDMPCTLYDESFTTILANKTLTHKNKSKNIDEYAASIILADLLTRLK